MYIIVLVSILVFKTQMVNSICVVVQLFFLQQYIFEITSVLVCLTLSHIEHISHYKHKSQLFLFFN